MAKPSPPFQYTIISVRAGRNSPSIEKPIDPTSDITGASWGTAIPNKTKKKKLNYINSIYKSILQNILNTLETIYECMKTFLNKILGIYF